MNNSKTFVIILFLQYSEQQIDGKDSAVGAVLQTALSLSHSVSDGLWKYLYGAATPQRLTMVLSDIK